MKILKVFSKYNNRDKNFSIQTDWCPYIYEQSLSLKKSGVEVDFFMIEGKGIVGYLKYLQPLKDSIIKNKYDIIHAYYGFCGMLSVLQRHSPVVISFLGSDINERKDRFFSKAAMLLSTYNIFVEKKLAKKVNAKKHYSIIPFGVDLNVFFPMDKNLCRRQMDLDIDSRIALFCSSASRRVKNYQLAKNAVKLVGNINIVQLQGGYTREEINKLINACDFLLMTSLYEGSPQIIKEAMACNCPIVSTDVGDVKEMIGGIKGCFITSFKPAEVAEKIKMALEFNSKTNGREKIKQFDLDTMTEKIILIYQNIINKN